MPTVTGCLIASSPIPAEHTHSSGERRRPEELIRLTNHTHARELSSSLLLYYVLRYYGTVVLCCAGFKCTRVLRTPVPTTPNSQPNMQHSMQRFIAYLLQLSVNASWQENQPISTYQSACTPHHVKGHAFPVYFFGQHERAPYGHACFFFAASHFGASWSPAGNLSGRRKTLSLKKKQPWTPFRIIMSSIRGRRCSLGARLHTQDCVGAMYGSTRPDQSRRMRDDLQENLGRFRLTPCPCCIKHVLPVLQGVCELLALCKPSVEAYGACHVLVASSLSVSSVSPSPISRILQRPRRQ